MRFCFPPISSFHLLIHPLLWQDHHNIGQALPMAGLILNDVKLAGPIYSGCYFTQRQDSYSLYPVDGAQVSDNLLKNQCRSFWEFVLSRTKNSQHAAKFNVGLLKQILQSTCSPHELAGPGTDMLYFGFFHSLGYLSNHTNKLLFAKVNFFK